LNKTLSWVSCPFCGKPVSLYRNPVPTVDVIIEIDGQGIILIKRKNPPPGWALPGGFVDYGETLEDAAIREALEETSLNVTLQGLSGVYSSPDRDPRQHTISTVFIATASGTPRARDDAADIGIFSEENIPKILAFDHEKILADYFRNQSSMREKPATARSL